MRLKKSSIFFLLMASTPTFLSVTSGAVGLKVDIKEWEVPTPNSHPHDPAVAPDRSLWYTGINSNLLGRLDPGTGRIKEYPLPTPDSGPHGLAADLVDPKAQRFNSWPIPSGGGGVRNTPEGDLYLACSGVNKVAIVRVEK